MTAALPLTELQRDALRELANVGAGHAATSLSQLLSGQRVAFQAPEAWAFTVSAWTARLQSEAPWVAGVVDVQGPARGTLWLLFAQPDSQVLAAQLSTAPPEGAPSDEAAVRRAAHAMGASALSAMGRLTGLGLACGAPVLRRSSEELSLSDEASLGAGLVLEVRLRAPTLAVQFLLLPQVDSVGPLLRSLRV